MAFFRTRSRIDVAGLSADDAKALQAATTAVADHPHDLRHRRVLADLCVRLEESRSAFNERFLPTEVGRRGSI
jgi:acyl transferase domain-containing protein